MSKVIQKSDWGYWDQLDGITLKDGERLRVHFPDGTHYDGVAKVVDRGTTIHDMGHTYQGEDVVASMEFEFHGTKVMLALRGMECERL